MENPKKEPGILIDTPGGGAALRAIVTAFEGGGIGKGGAVSVMGL
jgi:hypothetical protein